MLCPRSKGAGRVGAGILVSPRDQWSRFLGPTREMKKTLARFTGSSEMTSLAEKAEYTLPGKVGYTSPYML